MEFEVVVPDVEELREGRPEDVVLENARRKARSGSMQVGEEAVVLGVDTDVALDGRLLGKARSAPEARRRLEALSGRTHEVLSGVVLLDPVGSRSDGGSDSTDGRPERAAVAVSRVTFHALDAATSDLYVRSGEWRDRAGAYAIQGAGSMLVAAVHGDVSNVIGLPLGELLNLAPELGKSL